MLFTFLRNSSGCFYGFPWETPLKNIHLLPIELRWNSNSWLCPQKLTPWDFYSSLRIHCPSLIHSFSFSFSIRLPFVLSMFLLAVLISKIITDSDPSSYTISSRVCYYFVKEASSVTICSRVRVVVDVFLSTYHFLQLLVYVLIIQWHHYYFLSVFWKHGTVSVGKIPFMKYLLTDTKSVRILQRLVHELNTIQRRWHLRW